MMRSIALLSLGLLLALSAGGEVAETVSTLDDVGIASCQASDREAVIIYRDGIDSILAYMDSRPELFPARPADEPLILNESQREEARVVWRSYLDYLFALESIRQFHSDFRLLEGAKERASFEIMRAAFLAQYRTALDFIKRTERNPGYRVQFDESMPSLGIDEGMYARLKFRSLNVDIASQYVALEVLRRTYRISLSSLEKASRSDSSAILDAGKGVGPAMTISNAVEIVKSFGLDSWLPIQTRVAEWMGDTRVYRKDIALIRPEAITRITPRLRPGDVLFQRREWYLSNIGLPGFWTHAALFVGTAADRRAFFDTDDVRAWVRSKGESSGELEKLLAREYPDAYRSSRRAEGGHPRRVIEAIGEGVLFTTIEHSASADSMSVIRPRLTKKEIAIALYRAFRYAGRPYDFNFDFLSDDRLVCSELVYKAFEKGDGIDGIELTMHDVAGRKVVPPNEMVRQFDEELGTERQQFDFVLFLDGKERGRHAVESTVEDFRGSWRRPRWHVVEVAITE